MKNKHFYSHLVESTHLTLEIANLEVDNNQRVHLLSLVEANIHTTVVSTVLSNLKPEDKKIFLKNLSEENHEKTWQHISSRLTNAKDLIEKAINDVTKELLEDVKGVRKLKD